MRNILLIGDSFGTERVHFGIADVPRSKTWPALVKKYYTSPASFGVDTDFEPFRLLDDILASLNTILTDKKYELVIIQAGLVDCFPRPLPKKLFRSRQFFCKALRKAISFIRAFWLRYVYCYPMIPKEVLTAQWVTLLNKYPEIEFIYITITPQLHPLALETPRQSLTIDEYNKAFIEISNQQKNLNIFDLNKVCCQDHLHPLDSHLSLRGNEYLSEEIINLINQLFLLK